MPNELRDDLLKEALRLANGNHQLAAASLSEALLDSIMDSNNGLQSSAHRLDVFSTVMAWLAGELTSLRSRAISECAIPAADVVEAAGMVAPNKASKVMRDLVMRVLEKWRVKSSEDVVRIFCLCITAWIQSPDCKLNSPRATLDMVITQMVELRERLERKVS